MKAKLSKLETYYISYAKRKELSSRLLEIANESHQSSACVSVPVRDYSTQNIRGLMPFYQNTIQTLVKTKSGIQTYKNLKGKKVAVGIQSSSSPLAMQAVPESYGMSMNDIKPQYLAYGPSIDLKNATNGISNPLHPGDTIIPPPF